MVQPGDATARLLGIETPGSDDGAGKGQMARLFTLSLLRAGKNGCTCDACDFLQQLSDLMVADARSPFPAPSPQPPPAPPPPQELVREPVDA